MTLRVAFDAVGGSIFLPFATLISVLAGLGSFLKSPDAGDAAASLDGRR
jgi:hypothetical protein